MFFTILRESVCVCVSRTVLLEARYSSNPPGDSVLNSRTMEVEVARKDFWTNENPDPSKWKDVSSACGLTHRQVESDSWRRKSERNSWVCVPLSEIWSGLRVCESNTNHQKAEEAAELQVCFISLWLLSNQKAPDPDTAP